MRPAERLKQNSELTLTRKALPNNLPICTNTLQLYNNLHPVLLYHCTKSTLNYSPQSITKRQYTKLDYHYKKLNFSTVPTKIHFAAEDMPLSSFLNTDLHSPTKLKFISAVASLSVINIMDKIEMRKIG